MELLRLVETTNIGAVTREWVSYIHIKRHILTLPLTFLLFYGITCNFRTIEDCGGGLGGWICCHVDSSSGASCCKGEKGDGHELDGCSDG